jgi:TonB family protein
MRRLWLIFLVCGTATAQVDPEAVRLFHVAATQALQHLSSFDLAVDEELSTPTTTGAPRVNQKHISISVRGPGKEKYSVTEKTGTDTFVVSDNSVWAYSEYYHKYGTRPAAIRQDQILNPLIGYEILPREHDFSGAEILREESLLVDRRNIPCTVIQTELTQTRPDGISIGTIGSIWIDKKTGVALRTEERFTSAGSGTVTIAATRFLTGDDLLPVSFDRTPPPGSVEDETIFETLMLALPLHGADFVFGHADGTPLTAPGLAGKPAILSFSAAGCVPCDADLEAFDSAAKSLKDTWGQAYRVVIDDPHSASDATGKPPASSNFESASASAEQATRQGIQILPALMVMTPRGTIYRTIQGHVSEEYILKLVEEAKAQKVVSPGDLLAEGMVYANTPGVVAPVPTFKVPIQVPASLKSPGIAGTVRLGITVLRDGTVKPNVSVVKSLQPDLDALAVEAVQKWLFKPGTRDGKPANVMMNLDIRFTK